MDHAKYAQHIWVLLAKSFSYVVSELSQLLRFFRESILREFILEEQSSFILCLLILLNKKVTCFCFTKVPISTQNVGGE